MLEIEYLNQLGKQKIFSKNLLLSSTLDGDKVFEQDYLQTRRNLIMLQSRCQHPYEKCVVLGLTPQTGKCVVYFCV